MPRAALALATLAALLLAGCTQPAPPGGPSRETVAAWNDHPYLGKVLTDATGRTLYVFTRDGTGPSTCTEGCAATWPPVTVAGEPTGTGDLAPRLATRAHPAGGQQATLDSRPLYRYNADAAPGDAKGQGRGGNWFVVRQTDRPGQLNVDFLDGPGSHEVRAEDATYIADATGYLARPQGQGAFPGVVMVHEWWGLNEHIRAMARALASHGYLVLAVDLFHGSVAATSQEAQAQVRTLNQSAAVANLRAATSYLREQGATKVASLGWCFGGGQSLQLALSGEPLDATVLYYGTPVTDPARLGALRWPVLGVFGREDGSIPVRNVEAFDRALANLSVARDIRIYDGVGHAFANPSGNAYSPEQAMAAWARTLEFLRTHLGRA